VFGFWVGYFNRVKILAIDSSGPVVMLGVATEEEVLAERQFAPEGRPVRGPGRKSPSRAGELVVRPGTVGLLAPEISKILEQAGLKVAGLDGFALGAGPGSFTGLKVGYAAVMGMAFDGDKPIWTYPSLTLLALTLAESREFSEIASAGQKEGGGIAVKTDDGGFGLSFGLGKKDEKKPEGSPARILVLTEAKKRYFYRALFEKTEDGISAIEPVEAAKTEELIWPKGPVWVTGSALEAHREEIVRQMRPEDRLAPKERWHPSAGILAQLAASGKLGEPAGKDEVLEPIFLKSFETKFKEIAR